MKNKGIVLIIVVIIIVIALFGASMYQKSKTRGDLAKQIFSLGDGVSPVTLEELRASIAANEKEIERFVETAAKTGIYWKILAARLADRGLHGEALEALKRAIYYSPEDPSLHYSAGISAGILGKSFHSFPGRENIEREQYNYFAEQSFLRAIELDSRYLRPRYSLGVLYVFELDRPEDAIPHLQRCLEISRNDVDVMFVLARAFYMLEGFQEALDLYDRIITITRDEQKRADAQNNRQMVLGLMNG